MKKNLASAGTFILTAGVAALAVLAEAGCAKSSATGASDAVVTIQAPAPGVTAPVTWLSGSDAQYNPNSSGDQPVLPPGTPPVIPPGTPPVVPPGTPPLVPSGTPPQVPPGTPPVTPPGTPPVVPPETPPVVPPGTPPVVPPGTPPVI